MLVITMRGQLLFGLSDRNTKIEIYLKEIHIKWRLQLKPVRK